MGITSIILLWILSSWDSTHDLRNAKQMANEKDPYWKDIPGRILPPDTCKYDNHVEMHRNIIQARLSLPDSTFGTKPVPSEHTTVNEAAIDIGKDLPQDESWYKDDLN